MMKRHSIVLVVKVIICLLTPILLSFSGIGVNDIDKKKSTSKEDKFFYNELYNLSLQIKQQKLINEEKY